jgi:hypothetical protein
MTVNSLIFCHSFRLGHSDNPLLRRPPIPATALPAPSISAAGETVWIMHRAAAFGNRAAGGHGGGLGSRRRRYRIHNYHIDK